MSVLIEMAMFPIDNSESKSSEVAQIIKVIKDSGFSYELTAMGTLIETNKMSEALELIQKCYDTLELLGSNRVYITAKFDIRKNKANRLEQKVKSVLEKL